MFTDDANTPKATSEVTKPRIQRSTFNMVVRLKAEGFSWEDIANQVGLPVAEIQRYPDRRQQAWDAELARHARRATLEGVVQAMAHWQVLLASNMAPPMGDLVQAAETLVHLHQLQQPPKPKRTRQPRTAKTPVLVEVTTPNATVKQNPECDRMVETQRPEVGSPTIQESPAVGSPHSATETLRVATNTPSEPPRRWFATLRAYVQTVRVTVVRWVRAITPRFFLRC